MGEMTPASRLHALAGSPAQDGCEDHAARCVVCAAPATRTARYSSWQGAQFTDQNKLRGHGLSDRVCEPCVWAHAWSPPPDRPRAEGATGKGLNLRLFSHLWSERDGYRSVNKGDKPAIRAWLRARVDGERWWCAIADSGQKHTIPWTREQRTARGVIRFEDRDVTIGDWALLDVMTEALTAGVTKDEIESGQYTARAWELAEEHVRALLARGERERGAGWWAVALWLAQRDEERVAARLEAAREAKAAKTAKKGKDRGPSAARGGGEGRGGRARARGAEGVPGSGSERARSLDAAARPAAGVGEDERDGRAGGDGVPPDAAPVGAQLGLFGGGGAAGGGGGRGRARRAGSDRG